MKTTILVILSLVLPRSSFADDILKPRVLEDGTVVTIQQKDSLVNSVLKVQGESLFIIPRSVLERANAEKTVSDKLTNELKQCYLDLEAERSKETKPGLFYKVKWIGAGLAIAGAFYLGSRATQ